MITIDRVNNGWTVTTRAKDMDGQNVRVVQDTVDKDGELSDKSMCNLLEMIAFEYGYEVDVKLEMNDQALRQAE
jgi:hypothetical protein